MEGRVATMWFQEFFRVGRYKRNQGQIARRATFIASAVIVVLGCWRMSQYYSDQAPALRYWAPLVLMAAGLWASFRVVQMPAFADFLISVEGEMNKVSWPSRAELFRATLVVILVVFFLAFLLFAYDAVLTWILQILDGAVSWIFS
jgi:preprotein translocase subunit SecE